MNLLKKILSAVLTGVMVFSLAGCSGKTSTNAMQNYDFKEMNTDYIQLKPPSPGDKIAVIDTEYGEIRVVLYEQYAPNTVKNFIEKAQAGEYNNIPIVGVRNETYFLTGGHEDEKGNYLGRNSDDELVANEYSVDLWPFTGALLGYSNKRGYSDSQWVMVNLSRDSLTKEAIDSLKKSAESKEDELERENMITMFDTFYKYGGVFDLAGEYTVFGQTYLGLDVVKALTMIPTSETDEAAETVMINSVTISEFKEGDKTDKYPREPLNSETEESSDSGDISE